jgi:hypothetical protein
MFPSKLQRFLFSLQRGGHASRIATILIKKDLVNRIRDETSMQHTGTVYNALGFAFPSGQFSKIERIDADLIPSESVSISYRLGSDRVKNQTAAEITYNFATFRFERWNDTASASDQ